MNSEISMQNSNIYDCYFYLPIQLIFLKTRYV